MLDGDEGGMQRWPCWLPAVGGPLEEVGTFHAVLSSSVSISVTVLVMLIVSPWQCPQGSVNIHQLQ